MSILGGLGKNKNNGKGKISNSDKDQILMFCRVCKKPFNPEKGLTCPHCSNRN